MPIEKENEKEKNIENQVGSIEDRIEKLNSLLDKKIITKTEYNKKRKDILSEL